jgi:hypothetical protein
MTGFLASLAARSTGQARVLEPRRLYFEPRDDPAVDADAAAGPEPLAKADPRPPPAAATRAHAPRTAPAERQPAARETQAAPIDERPPTAPASAPRRRRSLVAGRVRTSEQPLPDDAVPRGGQKPPLAAAATPPARKRTSEARPQAPRGAEPGERTRAAHRHALRSPPVPKVSSPAREQIVRISIGRVDVRAVQAPEEKAEPAAPAAPKRMTLEEYLARGARG